jgi:CHAD domain-containing protein
MAEGKWIEGLLPEMPLAEAARLVLSARLDSVLNFLPLAADSAAQDIEHVHRLRVATRRATAALRLFGECLPEKPSRRLNKSLRSVRRAAGEARDWDVLILQLQISPVLRTTSARPALDFLIGVSAMRRLEAQATLVATAKEEEKKLSDERRDLLDLAMTEANEHHPTLSRAAGLNVAALIRDVESAASAGPTAYAELHQLRILGKKLRYSMETFGDCFSPLFREELYPAIEEMQETLGRITDAHVAAERFIELRDHMKSFHAKQWPRYRRPVEQLLQDQRRIIPRERKRFQTWWRRWQQLTKRLPPMSLLIVE